MKNDGGKVKVLCAYLFIAITGSLIMQYFDAKHKVVALPSNILYIEEPKTPDLGRLNLKEEDSTPQADIVLKEPNTPWGDSEDFWLCNIVYTDGTSRMAPCYGQLELSFDW
jgi:hypothetical protein